jgi:hypothetical protein
VTGNLQTGIGEIIKISSPVQRNCSGRYIDSTKLIYNADYPLKPVLLNLKDRCAFKFEKKSAAKWQSESY